MQIVTQVSDLNPADPREPTFQPIPSMLHFQDKTELEMFSLEDVFQTYDAEVAAKDAQLEKDKKRFAPKLAKTSIYETTADAIEAAKQIFQKKYMK